MESRPKIIPSNELKRLVQSTGPTYENCEIFLIHAHGVIDTSVLTEEYPIVPDNTYVSFTTPAGVKGMAWPMTGIPYNDFLIGSSHKELIDKLLAPALNGKNQFSGIAPGIFKSPNSPLEVNEINALLSTNEHNVVGRDLNASQQGSSIYAPKTPYIPTIINFLNNDADLMSLSMNGIYKLPISNEFAAWFSEKRKFYQDHPNISVFNAILSARLENLALKYMIEGKEQNYYLNTVLNDRSIFPLLSPGRFRIIIVDLCRGVIDSKNKEAYKRARRHSINLRLGGKRTRHRKGKKPFASRKKRR
jgi:hypothetical protein